jgi:hypothetical protein
MNTLQQLLAQSPDSFKFEFQAVAGMKDTPRLKAFLLLADKSHGGVVDSKAIIRITKSRSNNLYLVPSLRVVCLNEPNTTLPYKAHPRDVLCTIMEQHALPLTYYCPSREFNEISCLWLHSNILVIRGDHLFNDFWHTKVKFKGLEEI